MEKTHTPFPLSARAEPITAALWLILALTLWRVAMLAFNKTDLFVDEAQYWLWGQSLDFGYFSKPPLIAWIIRASTELGDSSSEFWVRLPAPLFHAVTAVIIMAAARTMWSDATAAAVGAAYISIPAVSFGSQIISTDTILIPFFAAALLSLLRLSAAPSFRWAVVFGLSIGLGAMAKYAMFYFVLCAVLVWMLFPQYRIRRRDALIAAIVAVAVISPNILWNISNDLSTIRHTADNASWVGINFNLNGLVEFMAGQFVVFGPILFPAYLWICYRGITGRLEQQSRMLIAMSLPILLAITAQAIVSKANANWAAMTFVAATLVTVPWLIANKRALLTWTFLLHLTFAIAFPIAAAFPDRIGYSNNQAFARILGRDDISERAISIARNADLRVIMAETRSLLASLFYSTHGTALTVYAAPRDHLPVNHYTNNYRFPTETVQPALLVTRNPEWLPCYGTPLAVELDRWIPSTGAFRGKSFFAVKVLPDCWAAGS